MTWLFNIPQDRHGPITDHLSPLSQASLREVFRAKKREISVTSTRKAYTALWEGIFKDESWVQGVMNKTYEDCPFQPIPTVVGPNLDKVLFGKATGHELHLIANDWGGDIQFNKDLFFKCLQDHDYDAEKQLIRFKKSGLRLQVMDILRPDEMIQTAKPAELFRDHGGFKRRTRFITERKNFRLSRVKAAAWENGAGSR
ncbi:hypothetical protein PG999_005576 [Apiospora kogelbergensis]|uniref:Uncharacterized protein n=1 Tax=Apiospora kogelbergensis TaxID=1337665 RepID=A0AAW0R2L4_9PEZI